MKRFMLSAAVALAGAQVLAAATADAAVRQETVRCGRSPKIERAIERALENANPGVEIKILLIGTCKESPTVAVDNVTIQSKNKKKKKRAKVKGTINFVGARRGKVTQLKISGKGSGVSVRDGATVDIIDNDIENNGRNGIGVSNSSFARITNNRISNNGLTSAFADVGIDIIQSSVRSWGNIISGNATSAVRVSSLGQYRTGNRAIAEGAGDILVQRGCTRRQDASFNCGSPSFRALQVSLSGLAEVSLGEVTGRTRLESVSNVVFSDSTVNGNVFMNGTSRLGVLSGVSGSGDMDCDGSSNDFYGGIVVSCGGEIPKPP